MKQSINEDPLKIFLHSLAVNSFDFVTLHCPLATFLDVLRFSFYGVFVLFCF